MTCDACEVAESNPWYAVYESGCLGCESRMLAHGYYASGNAVQENAARHAWIERKVRRQGMVMLHRWLKLMKGTE